MHTINQRPPVYEQPDNWKCPNCRQAGKIIPNCNEYTTPFGTVYPPNWGRAVCSECEGYVDNAEAFLGDF